MTARSPQDDVSPLLPPTAAPNDLQPHVEVLSTKFSDTSRSVWRRDAAAKIHAAHSIRQLIFEDTNPSQVRDNLRHLNGFESIIAVLRSVSSCGDFSGWTDEDAETQLELLQITFSVLAAALQHHWGNSKYFRKRIEGGGWTALKVALLGLVGQEPDSVQGSDHLIREDRKERFFGYLLACAVNDDTLVGLFSRLRRHTKDGISPEDVDPEDDNYKKTTKRLESHTWCSVTQQALRDGLGSTGPIQNPEMISVMIEVWVKLEHAKVATHRMSDIVSLTLPMVLSHLIRLSTRSLVAVHGTKALDIILPCLLDPALNSVHIQDFSTLANDLLQYGINSLDNAHFLYRNARSSALVAQLLHSALQESHTPPHIHFDLSLHGFASVELPDIGRPFPPVSSSAGYTLSIWLYIVAFDPNTHTTLFGAFDSSQTCFVLVYLEKDTHNLILQTSVTSSRPSVRFKSMSFQEKRWYHVCIVHRRPKTVSSSKASLFIDGEFVEQVKSHYPLSPPHPNNSGGGGSVSQTSARKSNAVQAFLGTPQDLATQLGRGVVSSQWRLASAHLFADALSDDLIAVYKQLGPRYSGNYQDCLGSFQTYQASAVLNLRNENLHPGKEEKSDIISAIRSKASSLLPESRIILNISPMVILDDDDRNNIDETQLLKLLSKPAARNLRCATRGGRNAIAVNGAIPSINDALLQPSGSAILTGNPIVTVPQSLDDAAWRIGGCAAVGLALLEAASTREAICRALNILFESIKGSWRNSEAMERGNGFGVLANLLAGKLNLGTKVTVYGPGNEVDAGADPSERGEFGMELLVSVLEFVGYVKECPEDSVINNPLAYRILLVDFDTWRSAAPKVQKLYYDQFVTFGISSKHHNFNGKRLVRMRVIKKWLDALKGDTFTSETFRYFMTAFRSLISSNLSAETLRSLALYITYAIHKPALRTIEQQRPRASTSDPRQKPMGSPLRLMVPITSAPFTLAWDEGNELPRSQVGLEVLNLYADILCHDENTTSIKKFARTVTNKWLLHLLADEEPTVVVLAAKILARLLVLNGANYVKKFAEKTGGFVIMRHRLKRWWNIPTIWPICFAVMFGQDVAIIDFERSFDLYSMLETFAADGRAKIVCPEILPVITAMLRNGLKAVTKEQEVPESPLTGRGIGNGQSQGRTDHRPTHSRPRSMSLVTGIAVLKTQQPFAQRLEDAAAMLQTVTRFLTKLHTKSQVFRDFTVSSNYVQELLFVLFPIVVSSDVVSPETELNARDSALTFDGNDVVIRPLSRSSLQRPPIVRTATVTSPASPRMSRAHPPLRRGSSFILISSDKTPYKPSSARLHPVMSPNNKADVAMNARNSTVEELLEIIIAVFFDQIFARKDFPGLGLFIKAPPGFQEHQAYFDSFLLRNTLSHLGNTIQSDQKLLWEPRVLTNLARFATHLGESVYEGWFIGGADPVLDFLGDILEYLQRPDVSSLKSVRLCSQIVSAIRTVLLRIVLLRLSELSDSTQESDTVAFLDKLAYWQTVILATEHEQDDFFRLLCYLLYTRLVSIHEGVRAAAVNFWRILLVQKPDETSEVLNQAMTTNHIQLSQGFQKLTELDNDNFLCWVDGRREDLDAFFFGVVSRTWEEFVVEENRKTEENARARISKRRERLKMWVSDNLMNDDILRRHEISSDHWRANIHASEHLKRQRALQDQQDNINFNSSIWIKMKRELHRPCGLFDDFSDPKWRLDQTEGRNRMRLRLLRDYDGHMHDYQPKRKKSQIGSKRSLSLHVGTRTSSKAATSSPLSPKSTSGDFGRQASQSLGSPITKELFEESLEQDEDFEIVDDPRQDPEDFEDKNRKVMRSLQRGDQVELVNNVSRVVGLEACEGLLILGKDYLYLLDNFFQRSDGEIVNVWQAPQEERDPYLQMISGREGGTYRRRLANTDHETRSWRWEDVLSISKRRFLFRDVAMEIFFVDGRSYLLTTNTPQLRDDLSQKLIAKASNVAGGASLPNAEDSWRLESLRSPVENPQTFGARFTSVFAQTASNPATRKWIRGEISNFHYLMLVNTMAGRTFNDLTQYPVFPWVLADYTSEDLDLSNPRSFRDLTKPMGCQTAERQAEFRNRYQSFAEMGDQNSPPFHYGTHYSSAMIVTSYLIRLQPFVQSYLLLQGGSFDHPDRLFYSIGKAWTSASRDNMTDVRELVPEFYFLPEFLVNINGYDFGTRQGTGGPIDTVALPPWAKGDPKIFIAKHREALESDYVSRHLHQWIDLVFGHKQRGDAALEATNVFHHLSYHGAKNLDTIDDPVERLATIGIIHNFGQTPHQVFQRPHALRDDKKHKSKRLDMAAESLTRLPFPLFEIPDRVSTLLYSWKHDRVLCSGAFRINIPPHYDRYMEWGFVDGSVRFYTADTKKLIGLFEHLHQGQLSYALFADSRTLITAGTDCTISAWALISTSKSVDLQPKACLFGHRASVTNMAVSRAFSALLTASADGQVILWDLNRLEFVREIAKDKFVECARINDVTGAVMLCHGPSVTMYTLNGDLLLDHNVCVEGEDCLTACAFYEGSGNEWLDRDLVFTGHKGGVVNIWNKTIREGKFVLDHVKRMNHLDPAGFNVHAAITCILPMAQVVYTSDEDGRVYEWDCIQRAT